MAEEKPYEYADKYVFYTEWYNELAEVVKPFLLSFYPHDQTLELYDMKYGRMFLRRTKVEGITLSSLYIGAVVNIFCRQIKVVDYANVWTKNLFQVALQKIFALVKPDAVHKVGDVIALLERTGYKLTKMKMGRMTNEAVLQFFGRASDEGPLPHEVVKFMTEGASVAIEAIGEDGLHRWLEAVGPADPCVARQAAPHSLRASLGTDSIRNAIHTSCSSADQLRESQIWFPPNGGRSNLILPTFRLSESTCCVIKPHAVQEGLVGAILNYITESGFRIEALEMFHLDRATAEEFYEVYRGVVPEYSSMVSQLSSGPCVALELTQVSEPQSSATFFRQLAGPNDPITAKRLQPNTIRAKFGTSTVHNAVHCTDLPDDAKLEVEYFFKLIQPK